MSAIVPQAICTIGNRRLRGGLLAVLLAAGTLTMPAVSAHAAPAADSGAATSSLAQVADQDAAALEKRIRALKGELDRAAKAESRTAQPAGATAPDAPSSTTGAPAATDVPGIVRQVAQTAQDGLSERVSAMRARLDRLRTRSAERDMWLRDWLAVQTTALTDLLTQAGLDLEPLLDRALEDAESGTGGPFEPYAEEAIVPAAFRDDNGELLSEVERLQAMRQLVQRVPLAAPLDEFHVTSGYGYRRDPFNGRRAMHRGLDMGAERGSLVRATAPGRVLRAGRHGAFGNLVEIDHGMGIRTRYAHLGTVNVEEGDEVGYHQPVGVIGSTGRSSGRHLHYEIWVEDEVYDPARFLAAGRQFVDSLVH